MWDDEEIDRKIGIKIRNWRNLKGWTQSDLAIQLGVSFQQIQKYENGKNSLNAGKLWQLSRIFCVPLAVFFGEDETVSMASKGRWALQLIRDIMAIESPEVRKQVSLLVREIATKAY